VRAMLGRAGGGQDPSSQPLFFIPHLRPTIYHLPPLFSKTFPPSADISFVFIYIPAKPQSFSQRSFVFNNIPASVRQKRILFQG